MEKTMRITESSELYRKIDALGLAGAERTKVMGTLEACDRLVNALYRAFQAFERVAGWLAPHSKQTPHPELKHR